MPVVWQSSFKRGSSLEDVPSLRSEVLEETFAQTYEEQPLLPGGMLDRANELAQAEGRPRSYGQYASDYLTRGPGVTSYKVVKDVLSPRPKTTKMDAASANKLAKDSGVDLEFDNDTTEEAVRILIERKRKENYRQQIHARSPGGVGLAAQKFAIAAGTTLADPYGMAMNFVPVVPEARYASWLNRARGPVGRLGVRAGAGGIEGAAGAAIYEPALYSAKQSEQADYDAMDSLINLSFGTVLGGGLHSIGGATADTVRSLRGIEQPWVKKSALRDAITAAIAEREMAPVTITPEMVERGGAKLDEAIDAALGAGAKPVVRPSPVVAHEVGDVSDHTATISVDGKVVGKATAQENGPYLQMGRIDVDDSVQSQGLGQEMMINMAREADKRGLQLASSASSVSPDQVHVYEALERRGFHVERSPQATINPETGNLVSHDPRVPVFTVGPVPQRLADRAPRNAAERVLAASDRQREAAMRIATDQLAHGEDVNVSDVFQGSDGARAVPEPETAPERAAEADEAVRDGTASDPESELADLEESAALEGKLTEQQARLLGIESDAAMKASENKIQRIEQWAQAAELAQICLVRGG